MATERPFPALCPVVPSVDLTTGPASLRDDPVGVSTRIRQIGAYIGDALPLESPWVWAAPMTHTTCLPDVEAESLRDLAEFLASTLCAA